MKTVGVKVWVVEGRSGEYSDYHEWPLAAFETEAEAVELRSAADSWSKAHSRDVLDPDYEMPLTEILELRNPYDPQWIFEADDTEYISYPLDPVEVPE